MNLQVFLNMTHSVMMLQPKLHIWERTLLYQKRCEGLAISAFFDYAICAPKSTL